MKAKAVDVIRDISQVLHVVAPGVERQILDEVKAQGAEIETLGERIDFCGRAFSRSFAPIGKEGEKLGLLVRMVGKSLQRK